MYIVIRIEHINKRNERLVVDCYFDNPNNYSAVEITKILKKYDKMGNVIPSFYYLPDIGQEKNIYLGDFDAADYYVKIIEISLTYAIDNAIYNVLVNRPINDFLTVVKNNGENAEVMAELYETALNFIQEQQNRISKTARMFPKHFK